MAPLLYALSMTRSLFLLTALLMTACQAKPPAANLSRVERLYEERLDGAASRTAQLMVSQHAPQAATAAWYGGLAEFRNRDYEQAAIFFKSAVRSGDPMVAGGAEAMLGQLAAQSQDYAQALRRYERAWTLLTGSDQRQVGVRALDAAEVAGNTLAADRWRARIRTSDGIAAPAGHPFALQAGAYRTRSAANSHATDLKISLRRSGLTPITVRTRMDSGGTWWLVQVGAFASRAEAAAARRAAPAQDLIVARVGQ